METFLTILYGILAFTFGIPLISIVMGLFVGTMRAGYNLKETLVEAHQAEKTSYKMYALGQGWHVIRFTPQRMMIYTRQVRDVWIDHAATMRYMVLEQFAPIRWVVWLVTIGIQVVVRVQYIPTFLVVVCFLMAYIIALPLWVAASLLCIIVLSVINLLLMKMRRAAFRCPACYKEMSIPTYLCPTCQTEHTRLQPGIYGVFWHRCVTCKMHLPTLDLLGRKRLARVCSHCQHPLSTAIGEGPDVHIALVGSTSAGKTSYLMMALYELKHASTKNPRYKITLPDPVQEQDFETGLRRLKSGQGLSPTHDVAPQAMLLRIQPPHVWLPRLVYFYNPAGTTFDNSKQVSQQGYYRYSNGLLFLIDPLTIPSLCQRHRAEIESISMPPRRSNFQVARTYEHMMQALEAFAGFHRGKGYTQPIAVVVNKVDLLHLEDEIGLPAAHALMARDASVLSQEEAIHRLVREFLCAHKLDNMVRDIESHFASVRYFSCSAAGRTPLRTLDPLLWLLMRTNVVK